MQLTRVKVAKSLARKLYDKELSSKQAARQLAGYLLETRRVEEADLYLHEIAQALGELGYAQANVRSAEPLSQELRVQVIEKIKKMSGARQVSLTEEIDSSLLGGLVIQLPEQELDLSLRHKLTRLKTVE